MSWIIELLGLDEQQYVHSYSNTNAGPMSTVHQELAQQFPSEEEAKTWASQYVVAYQYAVIPLEEKPTPEPVEAPTPEPVEAPAPVEAQPQQAPVPLYITIKQYTTQRRAQLYCAKVKEEVERRFRGLVNLAVNQLDAEVFQVELIGQFPAEIDLLGLE